MSDISETSPAPASSAAAKTELEQQVTDLRGLTIKLQSGLIVLTWLMIFFMFLQVYRGHKDVSAIRPVAVQWNKIIENANARLPVVQKLIGQLVEYARTHPDIQPLLAKYPIQVQGPPATTLAPAAKPAAPTPAPATTTPPPKK